ncbi:VIT1/CCC1 transporter family protein [Planctomonas sp. JC2975]|uniref:VIT1/CCC1 transporter family protein n=1 Tax=Planctomonas sp. JC2975 TaxID=2729626 RepID=UPI003211F38D
MPDSPVVPTYRDPHEYDHRHSDVSGGWLRAAVFGAMDGLVTNIALIAGIGAAGAPRSTIILAGLAGLVAGAFSMALGEYASVTAQNEQVDKEAEVERSALDRNPIGEMQELSITFRDMGMSEETAAKAAAEVHDNPERALRVHVTHELGIDPDSKPSPWIAGISSFVMFSIGAIVPLLSFLFGSSELWLGLAIGGLGLVVAGGLAAHFTGKAWWRGALRQLLFGAVAVAATYLVGRLLGVNAA